MSEIIIGIGVINSIIINLSKWGQEKIIKINIVSSIIILWVILYILLGYNSNNIEYQGRGSYGGIEIGIDGINIGIIIITGIIIPIVIIMTKGEEKEGKIRINKIIIISKIIIILLLISQDVLIFYILFELILIPLFIMIGLYGSKNIEPNLQYENTTSKDQEMIRKDLGGIKREEINKKRIEATRKFFLYSFGGSLFMLVGIIIINYKYSTTSQEILGYINYIAISNNINIGINKIIWILFFIPLLIKVPMYPLHTWLPLAHSEANTIGSIILAAIILKLGTYGMYRFLVEILYEINIYFYPIIYLLATISIIYGCMVTLRQIDIKRIIAYSSIIHINYSIISLFTFNNIIGIAGTTYLMITHGLVSAGMFIIIGILYIRYHTRIYIYYNNLATYMPIFTIIFFLFILNLISFPITSSFISELLIFISIYNSNIPLILILITSILYNTIFSLWLFNKLSFGLISPNSGGYYIYKYLDLSTIEFLIILPLLLLSYLLGIFPSSLIEIIILSLYKLL